MSLVRIDYQPVGNHVLLYDLVLLGQHVGQHDGVSVGEGVGAIIHIVDQASTWITMHMWLLV